MHFDLIDRVLSLAPGRIVTIKHVSQAEEYLQDHFPGFPVLPGVLMLEAMVQAGRRLVDSTRPADAEPVVLGRVRALKYGRFVQPGASLRVEVELISAAADGSFDLRGRGVVIDPAPTAAAVVQREPPSSAAEKPPDAPTAVSGRFTLRPIRSGHT